MQCSASFVTICDTTLIRRTPEDLTAIGIKKPHHRKKLTAEIGKLAIPDGLPVLVPQVRAKTAPEIPCTSFSQTIEELMGVLRLGQYLPALRAQGYSKVQDALNISIEDLKDIGFYQLGQAAGRLPLEAPGLFSTNDNQTYGTLPRPTATVHPLPTPMESDLISNDVHMPFANERSGTIKLKTSPTEAFARLQAEEASANSEKETKEAAERKEAEEKLRSSLLRTPTRSGNRTAGDVMDDISTMLADLTDELDHMLCSDSAPP